VGTMSCASRLSLPARSPPLAPGTQPALGAWRTGTRAQGRPQRTLIPALPAGAWQEPQILVQHSCSAITDGAALASPGDRGFHSEARSLRQAERRRALPMPDQRQLIPKFLSIILGISIQLLPTSESAARSSSITQPSAKSSADILPLLVEFRFFLEEADRLAELLVHEGLPYEGSYAEFMSNASRRREFAVLAARWCWLSTSIVTNPEALAHVVEASSETPPPGRVGAGLAVLFAPLAAVIGDGRRLFAALPKHAVSLSSLSTSLTEQIEDPDPDTEAMFRTLGRVLVARYETSCGRSLSDAYVDDVLSGAAADMEVVNHRIKETILGLFEPNGEQSFALQLAAHEFLERNEARFAEARARREQVDAAAEAAENECELEESSLFPEFAGEVIIPEGSTRRVPDGDELA
jgi:hypothetical protein